MYGLGQCDPPVGLLVDLSTKTAAALWPDLAVGDWESIGSWPKNFGPRQVPGSYDSLSVFVAAWAPVEEVVGKVG